jgi:hypothetical protein
VNIAEDFAILVPWVIMLKIINVNIARQEHFLSLELLNVYHVLLEHILDLGKVIASHVQLEHSATKVQEDVKIVPKALIQGQGLENVIFVQKVHILKKVLHIAFLVKKELPQASQDLLHVKYVTLIFILNQVQINVFLVLQTLLQIRVLLFACQKKLKKSKIVVKENIILQIGKFVFRAPQGKNQMKIILLVKHVLPVHIQVQVQINAFHVQKELFLVKVLQYVILVPKKENLIKKGLIVKNAQLVLFQIQVSINA